MHSGIVFCPALDIAPVVHIINYWTLVIIPVNSGIGPLSVYGVYFLSS